MYDEPGKNAPSSRYPLCGMTPARPKKVCKGRAGLSLILARAYPHYCRIFTSPHFFLFLPRPISFQSQGIKALFLSSNYFLPQSFQQSPLYSIQENAIAIATIFATDRTKCQSGQTSGSFVIERPFIEISLVEHNGSLR